MFQQERGMKTCDVPIAYVTKNSSCAISSRLLYTTTMLTGCIFWSFHSLLSLNNQFVNYFSSNYISPDVIVAFNCGLYRETGFQGSDSWGKTLPYLLKVLKTQFLLKIFHLTSIQYEIKRLGFL